MEFVALFVGVLWLLFSLGVLRNLVLGPRLPARELLALPERPYAVSIVLAGRDEGRRIEETIRRLKAQQHIDAQIIIVDDRSRDDTPQVLSRLRAEFPDLETIRIDDLPPGWLGKVHACHVGSQRATRPWILFTDADVHMSADLAARALVVAEREGADHLTLFPGVDAKTAITRAAVVAWAQYLLLWAPAARINRDRGRGAMGAGAFNLLRTEVYRAIGGHVPLRMEVVDDVKLGVLVRSNGFRERVYSAQDELEAEWAGSIWQVFRNTEKNWFAGMHYNLAAATWVIAAILALWVIGVSAPLWAPRWGWFTFGTWTSTIVPGMVYLHRSHWPLWTAILVPPCHIGFPFAGMHSVWKTLTQGGVRWRDTFYPLEELRAGVVRFRSARRP